MIIFKDNYDNNDDDKYVAGNNIENNFIKYDVEETKNEDDNVEDEIENDEVEDYNIEKEGDNYIEDNNIENHKIQEGCLFNCAKLSFDPFDFYVGKCGEFSFKQMVYTQIHSYYTNQNGQEDIWRTQRELECLFQKEAEEKGLD